MTKLLKSVNQCDVCGMPTKPLSPHITKGACIKALKQGLDVMVQMDAKLRAMLAQGEAAKRFIWYLAKIRGGELRIDVKAMDAVPDDFKLTVSRIEHMILIEAGVQVKEVVQ